MMLYFIKKSFCYFLECDTIADKDKTFTMSEVAKLINYIGVGRNKLFEILRFNEILRNEILRANNEPYQVYVDKGWFKIIVTEKGTQVVFQTVVYQKGVEKICELLDGLGYKKAVSVKDVAMLHKRDVKEINQLINKNRECFKDYVDIIDLMSDKKFEVILNDLELKTSNGQKYAYILSERGYFILLKFMNDEMALERYKYLVDHYFDMRKELKEIKSDKDVYLWNILKADNEVNRAIALNEYEIKYVKPLENNLQEEKKQRILGEVKLKQQESKVEFYDNVVEANKSWTLRDSAKMLNFNNVGQNILFKRSSL